VGIEGKQTNELGQITHTLTAEKLVHYPQADNSVVTKPIVTSIKMVYRHGKFRHNKH
jgi:lipopolysaccharide export system protein LptC